MFKKKLFGSRIPPACRYCGQGTLTQDKSAVLCRFQGVMTPDSKCRRFVYDPLSRVPRRQPALPRFSREEFKL